MALGWSSISLPAAAHPTGDAASDAAHAQQDLVGRSITSIEEQTAANAARIKAATGVQPGLRPTSRAVSLRAAAAPPSTDPGQVGTWSPVVPTPVVPVFQAVLPSGKILVWDSVGGGASETYSEHNYTRAMVWNPVTDTSRSVFLQGYNIFCAGYVHLPNGNILVAGGNKDDQLNGIKQTHIFDWKTETWSRGPDMSAERWYPSLAALGNGEVVIVAGGTTTAEVYQTNNTLRSLTGFSSFGERLYPFLVPRPDGKVELVGPRTTATTMDTSGIGAITASTERDGINREYGSFATYDVGKTLVAGGGNVTEDGQTQVPSRTAVVVDTSTAGATTVASTGSMALNRRQFTLTILADGSVLATGGETKAVDGLVDLQNAAYAAERWDPTTGAWTTLASASRVRQYHSAASLLPDGRVLTGGGGVCGVCTTKGYMERNVEYFTPPYLYKKDGSGQLASRPVITNSTWVQAGRSFTVMSPQATDIKKVGLVRLGAATHGDDQGQRYIPLSFTAGGSALTVSAPATADIAPPGYYMLFITDGAGVPSVAKIIKVDPPSTAKTTRLRSFQGTCILAQPPLNATSTQNSLTASACWRVKSATWQMSTIDQTVTSSGKCLTVQGRLTAGATVALDKCTGDLNQRWERRSDNVFRSATSTLLCLSIVGGSTAENAPLELANCTSGAKYQGWIDY